MRSATMKNPDPSASIPAPTAEDKRFRVKDELTVYEAALVYAARHPYPKFFGLKDGRKSKREQMLTYLNLKRPWAQLARDIFYQLGERIRRGRIKPIRPAYDPGGKIDLFRTVIATADLMQVVNHGGDECPKYLGRFETKTIARAAPKMTKRKEVEAFIEKKYPNGVDVSYRVIALELSAIGLRVSERTIRRARGRK
jgi:hypothetical protein